MSQTDPEDEAPRPNRLSGLTTPTWEIELLLSGATVFALMQLAQAMPAWGTYLMPRFEENWRALVQLLFTYGHSAVVLLVLAFVLHLGLRAYWVALVGINSVYPEGPRMDRMRAGPIARQLLREQWQDMPAAIERADNRATVVFAVGLGTALVLIPIMVTVTATYTATFLVFWALGRPDLVPVAWIFVLAACFLPYLFATLLDRRIDQRYPPAHWLHRTCRRVLDVYSTLSMGRTGNPLITLYSSHIGERRGAWLMALVMLAAIGTSTASLLLDRSELGPGSFGDFPAPATGLPGSVDGRHYASLMEPGRPPLSPYVPAPTLEGDYLPLVLPYLPRRHGHLLAGCPGAQAAGEAVAARDAAAEAARRCLSAGIELRLDGQPLDLAPEWYAEPSRDLRGLLYMLPVAGLAAGRHELTVAVAPAPGDDAEAPAPPARIPFWR